jgi:hypothetical protein
MYSEPLFVVNCGMLDGNLCNLTLDENLCDMMLQLLALWAVYMCCVYGLYMWVVYVKMGCVNGLYVL